MQNFSWKTEKEKTPYKTQAYMADNIKTGLIEEGWEVWTRFSWLRIGTSSGLL
jgi:hypothetical protein